jgi:hypothetical protein
MKLRTVLGNHAHVQPLKKGELCSDPCELDFIEYAPTNAAFKPMVREQAKPLRTTVAAIVPKQYRPSWRPRFHRYSGCVASMVW